MILRKTCETCCQRPVDYEFLYYLPILGSEDILRTYDARCSALRFADCGKEILADTFGIRGFAGLWRTKLMRLVGKNAAASKSITYI
jgi:hypothetical protein